MLKICTLIDNLQLLTINRTYKRTYDDDGNWIGFYSSSEPTKNILDNEQFRNGVEKHRQSFMEEVANLTGEQFDQIMNE